MGGIRLADVILANLPARAAYALADLGGALNHRMAGDRRSLVHGNLDRALRSAGRPVSGRKLNRLVRQAYIEQARYYLEIIRSPGYRLERVNEIVAFDDVHGLRAAVTSGPVVLVGSHFGNGEPGAMLTAAWGVRPVIPVEEIEPPELFRFIMARRAGGQAELVPVARSQRTMIRTLRNGGLVGIVADRDLAGTGLAVELFGHPTTVPTGPAALALLTGAAVWVACCMRVGPDRFRAWAAPIPYEPTGERDADVAALTRRITDQIASDILRAPAQWWGAFQPNWPDLSPTAA
jgi:KDO2-lipid IV(A) lauroyltransferase